MNESDPSRTDSAGPRVDITPRAAAREDLACATHVGQYHDTNQDAVALDADADGCHVVLVVADGVSSTEGAEEASSVAARSARDYLSAAMGQGMPHEDGEIVTLFERAFRRAHDAVVASAEPVGACTLAAAVAAPDRIVVGNIGDTRTYWFPASGGVIRLSIDDSLAQARMDLGMSRDEAEAGLGAHAITKWIGSSATDVVPRVVSYRPETAGWLLVCSDGLWNTAADPYDFEAIMTRLISSPEAGGPADPARVAAALVDHANACGGPDNITVAVWRRDL